MAIGATLVVIGALGITPAVMAATGQETAAAAESNIQIVQTPSGGGGICLPPVFAMRQSTRSDATTFRLIINVTAPICSTVNAVAAIYKMPGNGVAWPQTLLETAPFTLGPGATFEFLVGGGGHKPAPDFNPDLGNGIITAVTLERQIGLDWEVLFSASGQYTEIMSEGFWDASDYEGETVRLRIYDLNGGGWGHVNADNIRYYTSEAVPEPTTWALGAMGVALLAGKRLRRKK